MSAGGTPGEPARDDILVEIGEDVRRRRMEGTLLPSFERRLDDAFTALTPDGGTGPFAAILDVAEQSSNVDIEAPVASNMPGGHLAKGAVRKATGWYLDHVVRQLNRFTSATVRLLDLLDERVSQLEAAGGATRGVARLAPPFDHDPWRDVVGAAVAEAPGPVLHADCGDGSLLTALADRDVVAYGVDTRDDLLDRAASLGLDVRLEQPLSHLQGLDDASLGAAVLSGFVDLLALPGQAGVVERARTKLRPQGVLVVLATSPEAWARAVPVEVADLSPGRPLHAETWKHLLVAGGFGGAEVHSRPGSDDQGTFAIVGVRAS